MSAKEEVRLRAELRAASVLLAALMRQTGAEDLRRVFDNAVVREIAHMMERGARTDAIRAFEDAASEWTVRSRQVNNESRSEPQAHNGHRGSRQGAH